MKDLKKRAEQLVDQMTVEEMASQLKYDAPAIKRLGIPAYNWWNEALHGVARAGTATVFPQAIGLAAIFDDELLREIADVIATEARAKYNMFSSLEDRDIYKGLTMWSPNINIFRDPRWGRGHETYGEDPYLTTRLGVAFIKGLQGDESYLKTAACAKHFAVHSGPEGERHSFDAIVNEKDLAETYLPAFEAAVKEAGVESVMGAYNRVNGEPCCGHQKLLVETLYGKWGFDGHVVSDCWAIRDFHVNHMVTETAAESAALAIKNRCALNCGNTYLHLLSALDKGLIEEEDIRTAAVSLITTRMRLGMFDEDCTYDEIPYELNDCTEHRQLSLKAAEKSIVLLKNDGILPLNPQKLTRVAVIGPNADSQSVLEGNYSGTASEYITNLEGIRRVCGEDIRVFYAQGSHLYRNKVEFLAYDHDRLTEAYQAAKMSDVAILCLGLDATIEGEAVDEGNSEAAGDKEDLQLPLSQRQLLETVAGSGTPVIAVINSGSALDLSYARDHCSAVVQAWYSGARGGEALANILFGKTSPSGKLPITLYYDKNLPDFRDYQMKNRTYRYLEDEALYPFGYGLSYTRFSYGDLQLKLQKEESGVKICGSVWVENTGPYDGDEVVQVYIDKDMQEKMGYPENASYRDWMDPGNQPRYSLCAFKRVNLRPGERKEVLFEIAEDSLRTVLENGEKVRLAGAYTIYAGGGQPDEVTEKLLGNACLKEKVTVL